MTSLTGLIGFPVKHSVSAAFQQAAFDYLGIDARYLLWEVPRADLDKRMAELRRPGYLGANVTIPHKQAVIPLLDEVEDMAGRIGAVNTIANRDGRLFGFNTDAQGFLMALRREGGMDPRGRRAVLLGAGGAARAAAFMLLENQVESLAIVNRNAERARSVVEGLERASSLKGQTPGTGTNPTPVPQNPTRAASDRRNTVGAKHASPAPQSTMGGLGSRVEVYPWDAKGILQALEDCDLIVNCTPLGTRSSQWEGQSPLTADMIPSSCLVYDLVYNPAETPLLAEARKAGARTLPGLPMLVYQGAASFQLWTGREAPVEVMMAAARKALGLDAQQTIKR